MDDKERNYSDSFWCEGGLESELEGMLWDVEESVFERECLTVLCRFSPLSRGRVENLFRLEVQEHELLGVLV